MAFGSAEKSLGNVSAGKLAHYEQNETARKLNSNHVKTRKKKLSRKERKRQEILNKPVTSNTVLRLSTTDARTMPYDLWVHNLTGPGKWISEMEARAWYEMGYASSAVNASVKKRLMKAIVFGLVFMMVAVFGFRFFMKLSSLKSLELGVLIGAIIMFVMWSLGSRNALNGYHRYLYMRQLAFTKFERLIIPYLSQMKDGVSLFSMLRRVSARMDDRADQILIEKLMTTLTDGDGDDADAFTDFARRFGNSDSSRLFMLSLYQMYKGNYNDDIVKDLGKQSNEAMMKQVTEIANHKLKRFNFLTTELTMATIVVLFTYIATVIVNQFTQAFSQM